MNIQDYTDKYSNHYTADFNFERVLIEQRREKVLATLRKTQRRCIIEVGCGMEPLFQHYTDFEFHFIIEPSEKFCNHARSLAGADPRISITQGFIEHWTPALPMEPDAIVVSSLLHEVPDPHRLLDAVWRLCGSNTLVHVNTPNVNSFHRLLAKEMGLITDVFEQSETEKQFQRHTRFDRERLTAMVVSRGFEVLAFETYFIKILTHRQMESLVEKNIVDLRIVEGLSRMIRYMPDLGSEMCMDMKRSGEETRGTHIGM